MSCTEKEPETLFSVLDASKTGISFSNEIKETEEFNILLYSYMYNGGGVAIGDINNDGLEDVYLSSNLNGNKLYLNQGGMLFKDITETAGVKALGGWNTGVSMADVNGDGLLDIYVCRSGSKKVENRKNLLYINNGNLTFMEKAGYFGLDNSGYSTQASYFDYDNDGDLDLFLLNHSVQRFSGFGRITPTLKERNLPEYSDKFYENVEGIFKDVTREVGLVTNVLGFGLGVSVSDFNNDGWLDIYVGNDFYEQDYLYISNGDKTFTEQLESYMGHVSLNSMGTDAADFNNDGYTDVICLDMLPEDNYRQKKVLGPENHKKYERMVQSGFYHQTMRNMLQLNRQGTSFAEIGPYSGISNTDWSWGPLFADFNNDGWKDLYITNGYRNNYTDMDFMNYLVQEKINENKVGVRKSLIELVGQMPSNSIENYSYVNMGNLKFSKANSEWGTNLASLSNGAAYGDLDNDGDLDLVVNNIDSPAFVLRNNSTQTNDNHYLRVRLKGQGSNHFGIGAKVTVQTDSLLQVQELIPSRGYQSSVGYTLVFGLGTYETVDRLTVSWPGGCIHEMIGTKGNQEVIVQQDADCTKRDLDVSKKRFSTIFQRMPTPLGIEVVSKKNPFGDFNREALLLHKLSSSGSCIVKGDINEDGLTDFFFCGAKDVPGRLVIQNSKGRFLSTNSNLFEKDRHYEDTSAEFLDVDNDGDLDLYVVSGGNEWEQHSTHYQDRLYLNDGRGNYYAEDGLLPPSNSSGSVVASCDFDKDGDMDLFVGGGFKPGRYPEPGLSKLLINNGKGKFEDYFSTHTSSQDLGRITDALWSDYNSDGWVDLILVGEWRSVEIIRNNSGVLQLGLEDRLEIPGSKGWWNRIVQADFDKDGDMDYVVGNFGLNFEFKASMEEPIRLYYDDFDNNGAIDPIICSYNNKKEYPIYSKDDLQFQLPFLKEKYPKYDDFARHDLGELLSDTLMKKAKVLEVNTLSTCLLKNLGNEEFELRSLPPETQLSPVYELVAEDFDADGNMDLLLAGNLFGARTRIGRIDANSGVLLKGDGKCGFKTSSSIETGLSLKGEVRSMVTYKDNLSNKVVLVSQINDTIKAFSY